MQSRLYRGEEEVGFDRALGGVERLWLDPAAWVDLLPGWVKGADWLYHQVLGARELRRADLWREGDGPLEPRILEELRSALSFHYQVPFDSVAFHHYRDGNDAVGWHRDRIARGAAQPVVAIVSLGEPRTLSLRRVGGRTEHSFSLGRGDLLVTGGHTQAAWEHAVPPIRTAVRGRVSLAFRHGPAMHRQPAPPRASVG